MSDFTRREGLGLLAGVAAAGVTPRAARSQDRHALFAHGVASGDPGPDSVVLWTRVSNAGRSAQVTWQIASDVRFGEILQSGEAEAAPDRDFTVKVVPQGLSPGRTYFYRFILGEESSPTGRTKTLPTGRLERLGVALMSCANFTLGYFSTYDAVAKDPAIDVVLHTGDYIYEYGNDLAQRSPLYLRPADPPHETVTLEDYRRRHATHKSDPHSQAMHAAHPMIAIWDDHETANDSWRGGAENHQAEEGDWSVRSAAALRAYYEWMPLREPAPGRSARDGWRTYQFGDLATLVTLETRLSGRSKPLSLRDYKDDVARPGGRARLLKDLADPRRQMLSPPMKDVLGQALAASVQSGQAWRLIGNGALMARIATPDMRKHGVNPDDYPEIGFLDKFTDIIWSADNNLPEGMDSWEGYGGARQDFYELAQRAGAQDLLVLTGDSHSFWSNDLMDDHGVRMGVELGTAGVNVPSGFEMGGFRPALIERLDALYAETNAEVRWTNSARRGYVRLVLGQTEAKAEFVSVETTKATNYQVATLRTEHIQKAGASLSATPIA